MMYIALLACLSVCLAAPTDDVEWKAYKTKFEKVYTVEEDAVRYDTWLQTVKEIEFHNSEYADSLGYEQGINQFTDMTPEEFKKKIGGCYKLPEEILNGSVKIRGERFVPSNVQLPSEVNWVPKGYVTQVKNQGQCGSCYSFAATGALEGQWFKKTGRLPSLSEQQIVDCSGKYGNEGCGGGWYEASWKYIRDCGGNQGENTYPYTARRGWCQFNRQSVVATDTGFFDLRSGDENALKEAVATKGPVAVAIDASKSSFQRYRSGVYYEPYCGHSLRDLDHAVLVVGYGTERGQDYWLVKNSWGNWFGQGGYIKMMRNYYNHCGIATQASYPKVEGL